MNPEGALINKETGVKYTFEKPGIENCSVTREQKDGTKQGPEDIHLSLGGDNIYHITGGKSLDGSIIQIFPNSILINKITYIRVGRED